jgi:endonuclease/exonuclease/phosphatase family metal-dependent hydrolase
MTGDMNEGYPSTVFDPLDNFMENVREVAPETDRKATSNGFGSSSNTIDHIFFAGFEARSYRTVTESWNGIKYISDHYPVTAVVEFINN